VPRSNPAFQFVSNRHGEVTRFAHERPAASRDHIRTLVALRVLVLALSVVTALLIYALARLILPDPRWAVAVAAICASIPQFSFVSAIAHPEIVTRLAGVALSLLIAGRALGRVSRAGMWLGTAAAIAIVPFADRQAFFLVPFAIVALIATETTWRSRAFTAISMLVPAVLAFLVVTRYMEEGTDLGPWFALLRHPLRPFFEVIPSLGANPPDRPYYAFEFAPKLFMGFWGWLGQPSILLPAWVYALLAAALLAAMVGLALRLVRPEDRVVAPLDRQRILARRLMAAGVLIMFVPIVYGPALVGRNLWYGRWLFPMLGPIVAGMMLGWLAFGRAALRRPGRAAAAMAIVAAAVAAMWVMPPGAALRAGIQANHYGDRDRLVETVRNLIIVFAAAPLAVAIAATMARRWRPSPIVAPYMVAAVACALNLALLVTFVRPLYQPLTADEYVVLVQRILSTGATTRAADTYALAATTFPDSSVLRRLSDAEPQLLLGSDVDAASGLLLDRLARAGGLADRQVLLRLAREAAGAGWAASDSVHDALAAAEHRPDLAEPVRLLRHALAAQTDEALPAGISRLHKPLRSGEAILEGYTLQPLPSNATQLILYFRTLRSWDSHRIWVHAYQPGAQDYVDLDATFPQRHWSVGDLGWEVFDIPPGTYLLYAGVWVGSSIGEGLPLGPTP
jgi:hypothetical protein